ncbi:MAG: hypothetical protein ACRDXX_11935 [Stackebrandtia sp.]
MTLSLAAVVALIAVTLCYVLACAYAPFGSCWRCDGAGHIGRTRRHCRRCDGRGKRVRLGRRLHTWIKHEHRNSHR